MVALVAHLAACGGRAGESDDGFAERDAATSDAQPSTIDGAARDAGNALIRDGAPTPNAVDAQVPAVDSGSRIVSVSITASAERVPVGGVVSFKVWAAASDGTMFDASSTATWLSSNPSVLSVSNKQGYALTAGMVQVTVAVSGVKASVSLVVSDAKASALYVSTNSSGCTVGEQLALTAQLKTDDGQTRDVSDTVKWEVSTTALRLSGRTALCSAPGVVRITASLDGLIGETKVEVQERAATKRYSIDGPTTMLVGELAYYSLYASTSAGGQQLVMGARWESSSPEVLRIDGADGASARAPGTAELRALVSGILVATKLITISPSVAGLQLQSIAITPAVLDVIYPAVGQLKAIGTYSNGQQVDITNQVFWEDPSGKVNVSAGEVIANAAGSTSVRAVSSDLALSATAKVNISPGTTARTLSTSELTVPAGFAITPYAVAEYPDGSSLDVSAAVTWRIDDPTIASVKDGRITGLTAGKTSFVATLGAMSSTAQQLTVNGAHLLAVEFNGGRMTLFLHESTYLGVLGTFDEGSMLDLAQVAELSSGNPLIATVGHADNAAVVQSVGVGTTTLKVSYKDMSATTTVTVTKQTP